MLGNWSFGDYFKREAITWAWQLLTDVWGIDPDRLHVTVFEGDPDNGVPRDDEAAGFWREVGVPPERLHLGNKKDNFWEMGDTGPCGPCTEIHYDGTPDKSGAALVNQSSDQVIEIWNNVFIQFNRNADKTLTPLPAKHVDTGMGFERIVKVLQGKTSNYDTDVFSPIIDAIGTITGKSYGGRLDDKTDEGFRVIADHARMATFAITDGARPGNKKGDAVLRSVIRRAVRYGYMQFDRREPFVFELVPVLVEQMGDAFPELRREPAKVADIIRREEKDFFGKVAGGIKLFDSAVATMGNIFEGKVAADLKTTFGFPGDMTAQMARERGLSFDEAGYDAAIEEHKKRSRGEGSSLVVSAVSGELPRTDDSAKYGPPECQAVVLGWVVGNDVVREGSLTGGDRAALLIDRSPFYAEQGGQVGDTGTISGDGGSFEVESTKRLGDAVLHFGELENGEIRVGDRVSAIRAEPRRSAIATHHTATHLMNLALRRVLGDHVDQKGSLLDDGRTRFDFSHDKPLTPEQIASVEAMVNEQLAANRVVSAEEMPLAQAKELPGVRAVFGEKYPDPVRVVQLGRDDDGANLPTSLEFCGGTHLTRTGEAVAFKIVSQEGPSKGVRRVTAVAGESALNLLREQARVAEASAADLKCSTAELPAKLKAMQDEIALLRQQVAAFNAARLASAIDALIAGAEGPIVVGEVPNAPVEQMRNQIDRIRQKLGSAAVVLFAKEGEKVPVLIGLTDDLIAKGLSASELIKPVAQAVGGSGGGKRPDLAQAGGKDGAKIPDAIALAKNLIRQKLGE